MRDKACPGVVLAAPKSGSGKTTITCSLLGALLNRGMDACAFKCGPDYIDPMFHREVIGIVSRNLDSYFAGEERLRANYINGSRGHDISVVEGVMGLYDGVGGVTERASTYEVASMLGLPIILVVDGHGCGRSIIPLIAGFLKYDRSSLIRGVILNNTTKGFCERIAPLITEELGVEVLGSVPRSREISVDSRHLGLLLPGEIPGLRKKVEEAANILEQNVDVGKIVEIAGGFWGPENGGLQSGDEGEGPEIDGEEPENGGLQSGGGLTRLNDDSTNTGKRVRIGVARDEAFCFYYEENLELLEECGAELVLFSPIHDEALPEGLDGLLLGGGYPENYADKLEENLSMRRSIADAIRGGMPSVAECGGFMYLHEGIEDGEGNVRSMCGLIPGNCRYKGRLVRFGYVELTEKDGGTWTKGAPVRGHEFHYYESDDSIFCCVAKKPHSEASWECVQSDSDHFWGFPHLYYPSCPGFAEGFVEKALAYRTCQQTAGCA